MFCFLCSLSTDLQFAYCREDGCVSLAQFCTSRFKIRLTYDPQILNEWVGGRIYRCMHVCMYGCMDVWMGGWIGGYIDVCMYVWIYRCMYVYGWMDGCIDVWMYGWVDV